MSATGSPLESRDVASLSIPTSSSIAVEGENGQTQDPLAVTVPLSSILASDDDDDVPDQSPVGVQRATAIPSQGKYCVMHEFVQLCTE